MRKGAALAAALAVSLSSAARAGDVDLTLERLIGPPPMAGAAPVVGNATRSAYAGLVSELGVALSPRALQPADSLGWSGFAASFDASFTQVSRDADYWRLGARNLTTTVLPLVGATIRKGLWLGAPSLELSLGGHRLIGSDMATLEVGAKLAIHEGFHGWAIPSIAVRVAVAHLFGSPQVALTVLEAGVLVSKRFAVRGALQLDPFVGLGALVVFSSSQVIDTTPEVDAYRQKPLGAPDENANVTLPDLDPLPRLRVHGGLRLKVSLFQLTVEGAFVPCNGTGRDCQHDGAVAVVDRSGGQAQASLSLGVVY